MKLQVHQKSAVHPINITYWCEHLKTLPWSLFVSHAGSRLLPLLPKNFVAWTQIIKMIAYVPGRETISDAVELCAITGQFIWTEETKVSDANTRFWAEFPQEPQISTPISTRNHFYPHILLVWFLLV